jgi:uncharacterized phage protein (TIGR02220 family)
MSNLLINESPIMIIPSLAVKLGLNEAVVLQQVHYWLKKSKHQKEGRSWIYNTYKEWQEQIPFWSESTIKRAVKSLEEKGLLLTANWNLAKFDHTKWYSIDYEKVAELEGVISLDDQTAAQTDSPSVSNGDTEQVSLTQAIPEITSENTTEINKNDIPFKEIINYLNAKTHSSYKATTKKTRELIHARWIEGFTLADFQRVIDLKAAEWKDDPYWSQFLRPVTLFGPKFESYLNQKSGAANLDEGFDINDY